MGRCILLFIPSMTLTNAECMKKHVKNWAKKQVLKDNHLLPPTGHYFAQYHLEG